MPIVNVQGFGRVRFPDEMAPDAIENAIQTDIEPLIKQRISDTRKAADQESAEVERQRAEYNTPTQRFLIDPAISVAKGVVALPQAAVGLASLATGGRAGKLASDLGVDFAGTQKILESYKSDDQLDANTRVQAAVDREEGFLNKLGAGVSAGLQNPSTIVHAAVESAPAMLGGAAVGRGILAAASKLGPAAAKWAAGAAAPAIAAGAGEGVMTAGQTAEAIREQTGDKLLTWQQAGAALGAGLGTGVIGAASGRLAQKLGLETFETMLAGGQSSGAIRNRLAKVIGGALNEGVLEELPQSAQEQIWQNKALGRPWDEGVAESAAAGLLAGGFMGGLANVRGGASTRNQPPQLPPPTVPATTPTPAPGAQVAAAPQPAPPALPPAATTPSPAPQPVAPAPAVPPTPQQPVTPSLPVPAFKVGDTVQTSIGSGIIEAIDGGNIRLRDASNPNLTINTTLRDIQPLQPNAPQNVPQQGSVPVQRQRVDALGKKKSGPEFGDSLSGPARGAAQVPAGVPGGVQAAEPAAVTATEAKELGELEDLMERKGQSENKVKGVKFSAKDKARFKELLVKYRSKFREQVNPESDPVVGKDIRNNPIHQSERGTYYTVENGRIRTGPSFAEPPAVVPRNKLRGEVPARAAVAPQIPAQKPEPQSFESVGDLLAFRETRMAEERDLYRRMIGLSEAEAATLQRLLMRDASTAGFEKNLTDEQRRKMEDFFENSIYNQRSGPFMSLDYDKRIDPVVVAQETDTDLLLSDIISALDRSSPMEMRASSDRFIGAAIAARRFAELGGSQELVARYVDQFTTNNSGSMGDKAEYYKSLSGKIGQLFQSQGITLPEKAPKQVAGIPSTPKSTGLYEGSNLSGRREEVGRGRGQSPQVASPWVDAPERVAQDLASSGAVLRAGVGEISRVFADAGRADTAIYPEASGLRGTPPVGRQLRAGEEGGPSGVFQKTRVFISEPPAGVVSNWQRTADLLARRILYGAGDMAGADFNFRLTQKLPELKFVFAPIGAKADLAQYQPDTDAVVFNTDRLGRFDATKAEDQATLDAVLAEELVHAISD